MARAGWVGIARALASKPKLLLLDEPAAGLDANETVVLGGKLKDIVANDVATIFLIYHDMEFVMGICDHLYVLDFGTLIANGTPTEMQQNPLVRSAYLGTVDEEAT